MRQCDLVPGLVGSREDEDGRRWLPGAGRQARLPLKVAPALVAQLLLGEPESLLMLLPPPFLAVELSPNPISATFDTQQSPSLLPPLSLSLLTHSFTFQTIGVPDTQQSGASGGFMAGLTKVGCHQGWPDSHGLHVHKYAICRAAYLMHR